MNYPQHTDANGITWEFDYVVGQFGHERDTMYYRELGNQTWIELPEWAGDSIPDHINEHFFGPLFKTIEEEQDARRSDHRET